MYTGKLINVYDEGEIEPGLNRCTITMDDFSGYTIFGNYNELLDLVDKEVEFSTRKDVVHGIVTEVVNTIAVKSIVQTVADSDVVDDIELPSIIPNNSQTVNIVTFDKNTLKSGDVALAQVVLVVDYKNGKSKIAKWKEFTCLDRNSQVFNLRLFTNDDSVDEFAKNVVGHYAMVGIKNTPYGFQVHDEIEIYEHELQVPSEVLLAAMRLRTIVDHDPELSTYVKKYDFIEKLKGVIYFEPGYHLVEMMAECIMIDALCRIFEGYDKKLLRRTVFASRGYLLGANTKLSNPIVNYHRVITTPLKEDIDLLRIIDITSGVEEGDVNKSAYLSIRRMVTSIMKERRGISEKNSLNVFLSSLDSEFSGMFSRGFVELD